MADDRPPTHALTVCEGRGRPDDLRYIYFLVTSPAFRLVFTGVIQLTLARWARVSLYPMPVNNPPRLAQTVLSSPGGQHLALSYHTVDVV